MYNGIGLNTARGSGTNGYVQTNKAFIRPQKERVDYRSEEALKAADQALFKEPNKDILAHERKRQVEVKCLEMEDLMQQQGYSEAEILQKVTTFRQFLSEKEMADKSLVLERDANGRVLTHGSHEVASATQQKNNQLKDALGISRDYVEGSAMSRDRLAKEQTVKEERLKSEKVKEPAVKEERLNREKMKELTEWIKSDSDGGDEVDDSHSKKKKKKERVKKNSKKKKKNKDRSRSRSHDSEDANLSKRCKANKDEAKDNSENNRRQEATGRRDHRHEERRDQRHEDRRDQRHEERRDQWHDARRDQRPEDRHEQKNSHSHRHK